MNKRMVFKKPNWGPPPEGYIAGLGRGATGFVTRGDLGPSKLGEKVGEGVVGAPPGLGKGRGRGMAPGFSGPPGLTKEDPGDGFEQFDKWNGFEQKTSGTQAEPRNQAISKEETEADNAYANIDEYIEGRRKRDEKAQAKKVHKIQENLDQVDFQRQFGALKEKMKDVSQEQWEELPEAPDLAKISRKRRNQEYQRYTPVPDSILQEASNQAAGQIDTQIDAAAEANQTELGQARGHLLSLQLDQAQENKGGTGSDFNRDGYMAGLNNMKVNSSAEINDLKKARALLKSVVQSNPKSSSGWIAAARVEELDGKVQEARNILERACSQFYDNEDIWLEAARLSPPEQEKIILAKAIRQMPKSKKLWLQAASRDTDKRSDILMKALEHIPNDVDLWKEATAGADDSKARTLLYRAVQCVPHSTELWLALAKLETYDNAKQVLNTAISTIPTDHTIWVSAAMLEEASGNSKKVFEMIKRAFKKLLKQNVKISRADWLKEAIKAEQAKALQCCQAIIRENLKNALDLGEKEVRKVWIDEALGCKNSDALHTAKFILEEGLKIYPTKKKLWNCWISIEEQHGSDQSVADILKKAMDSCTKNLIFILRYCKHLWKKMDNPNEAVVVLQKEYDKNQNEHICLALQKLMKNQRQFTQAEKLLSDAIYHQFTDSIKIWIQAIQLQRQLNNNKLALELVKEASEKEKFKNNFKIWVIKSQILVSFGNYEAARENYEEALQIQEIRKQTQIWICASNFEIERQMYTKARTILQKARLKLQNDEIWQASIHLEILSDNLKIARNLCSQALQKFPKSGIIWALSVRLEPASTQKTRAADALKAVDNSPWVFLEISKIFLADKKTQKAIKFLKQAVCLDSDNGDIWIQLIKVSSNESEQEKQELLQQFEKSDPCHGIAWPKEFKKVENWSRSKSEILQNMAKKD